MAKKKKQKEISNPWTFQGLEFTSEMIGENVGFVYCITFLPTGQKYIGKKNFWSKRKPKGKTRRVKSESDWQNYFSSSDLIKSLIKEHGKNSFKREIISLHTLQRDVNYCEVREQWKRDVLETLMPCGKRLYLNENIQGKFFPGLYIEWRNRSLIDDKI